MDNVRSELSRRLVCGPRRVRHLDESPLPRLRRIVSVAVLLIAASVVWALNGGHLATPAAAAGEAYVAVQPVRAFDSRGGAPRGAGSMVDIALAGQFGIPAISGATSVFVNITAVGAAGDGFLTVWPAGRPQPNASTLNVSPGSTVANGALVELGAGGRISVFTSTATHLLVDVQGYVPAGGPTRTLQPSRLVDTRPSAATLDGRQSGTGPVSSGGVVEVDIAGRAGMPASGIGGVFLNVTAVAPSAAGFLTVWPSGDSQPNASNLNHRAGQTIANNVFVAVGAAGSGRVSVFASASTHLIVDVVGWVPVGAVPVPTRPARLMDTRPGAPTVDGVAAGWGPIRTQASLDVQITGRAGVPSTGVGAAIVNITAVAPRAAGFLTAWPTGSRRPDASVLNYTPGGTVANGTIVPLGDGGRISLYSWAETEVIVDVVGWIPGVTPQPAKIHGINMSPFLGGPPPVKLGEGLIHELTDRLSPYTQWIRTYECSGYFGVFPANARRAGMKVALGAWLSRDSRRNRAEIECIVGLANAGFADIVVVGSETLRRGDLSEAQLLAYVAEVNSRVQVPVTTAETDETLRSRPNVIAAVDVVFANIYPFWVGIPIEQAAGDLADSYGRLQAIAAGRQVIISETGWPTCGNGRGAAVPSNDNASRYLREVSSWASTNGVPWFWFSAYDEAFKGTGTLGQVEACWGSWTAGGERKYDS